MLWIELGEEGAYQHRPDAAGARRAGCGKLVARARKLVARAVKPELTYAVPGNPVLTTARAGKPGQCPEDGVLDTHWWSPMRMLYRVVTRPVGSSMWKGLIRAWAIRLALTCACVSRAAARSCPLTAAWAELACAARATW